MRNRVFPAIADSIRGERSLVPDDLRFIQRAANYLERPSFLIRIANYVGMPVDALMQVAPDFVHEAALRSLQGCLRVALTTVPPLPKESSTNVEAIEWRSWWSGLWNSAALATSGAAGGALGIAGLPMELPLSTMLMLRSIATIATEFGEDLRKPESRLSCLSVFALGGPSQHDDEMESSYLGARFALAAAVSDASMYLARTAANEVSMAGAHTAPIMVQLLTQIAARFNIIVSEKIVAQGIPIVGAAAGVFINLAFSEHFNSVARFHFGIRKLEREYGKQIVQNAYRKAIPARKAWEKLHVVPRAS